MWSLGYGRGALPAVCRSVFFVRDAGNENPRALARLWKWLSLPSQRGWVRAFDGRVAAYLRISR